MSPITEQLRPAAFLKLSLLGLVLLWALLIMGGLYVGAYHNFSAQAIEETIQSWGAWGIAASIGLMVLHSFVPFPAEFLAMANGMVVLMVLIGDYVEVMTWETWLLVAVCGVVLGFALRRQFHRFRQQESSYQVDRPEP